MTRRRMTLSQLTSEAVQFGQHFCDGSFGEPVGEMNALIASHERDRARELLERAGWTAQEFDDEVTARTTGKWVYNYLGSFFQTCMDEGLFDGR